MKKHNGVKVVVIVAVCFLIIGAILVGAGFASGGSLRYLSVNNETASWWPFEYVQTGINLTDDEDVHLSTSTYHESLQDVKSIEIQADAADIEIRRANTSQITYKVRKKEYVTITQQDGYVKVVTNHHNHLKNVNTKIIMELQDNLYDKILLDCKLGDIDIVNMRTKSLNISSKLGDIDVKNVYSEDTYIDQKSGDVDVDGVLLNRTTIENKLGEISVKVKGEQSDYHYHVIDKLGDSEILGVEHEFSTDVEGGNSNSRNYIVIEAKLGDVDLDIHP